MAERTLLLAVEDEVALIGAAMYGPEACADAIGSLDPGDFYDPVHGRIWATVRTVVRAGGAPHVTTVARALADDEGFREWGGQHQLTNLFSAAYLTGVASHVEAIRDAATRRRASELSQESFHRMGNETGAAFSLGADMERSVSAILAGAAPAESNLVDARTAAMDTVSRLEGEAVHGKPRGLRTGLRCWDYRLRGLQPGWLVVLAGRPSMGKTALARSTALAAARINPGHQFVFFALEMDRDELSQRQLSELSFLNDRWNAVEFFEMHGDKLDAGQLRRLRALEEDVPQNFIIDDAPVLTVEHIRRRLHALKRRGPIGAVFIDYLQIMERPKAEGRNQSDVIGEMTRGLKNLARELGVCIVLLSQLNRGVESRDNKRPAMSDLRESGNIEQDANAILFCFREHYYLTRNEPKRGTPEHVDWEAACAETRRVMEVIVPKVRAGPEGSDQQSYFAEYDHVRDPDTATIIRPDFRRGAA